MYASQSAKHLYCSKPMLVDEDRRLYCQKYWGSASSTIGIAFLANHRSGTTEVLFEHCPLRWGIQRTKWQYNNDINNIYGQQSKTKV